jgi:pimeloyl-ACP methyl ester carboxylesterase
VTEAAVQVQANGIRIEVEDTGADGSQAGRPVVLLIMGLGMQLVAWPPSFVQALVDQGFRVVRFDNRDIGLSQHFDHLGVPNILWESLKHRVGLTVRPPYTVADMAADAIGVLDALGIDKAHVVGVSMGGMIAQRVALAAPHRTLSLTSIMSSSGARHLPGPQPQVLRALLGRPKAPANR